MPQVGNMDGKVALVTGAASGLGRATAMLLAEAGASLCLVDHSAQGLEETATAIRALGREVLSVTANLADPDACKDCVEQAAKHFGRLDALCNVAGVMMPGHSGDLPVADFQLSLAVNLAAPFYTFQAALPYLLEAKGSVVNVVSAVGQVAQAYTAAYCASKAGLIHLTKSLAIEYTYQPIRINAVAPGGMMTPVAMKMMELKDADPRLQQRTTPMRGLVEIGTVAEMVAYLATDAAEGYHGSIITIDNGMAVG